MNKNYKVKNIQEKICSLYHLINNDIHNEKIKYNCLIQLNEIKKMINTTTK